MVKETAARFVAAILLFLVPGCGEDGPTAPASAPLPPPQFTLSCQAEVTLDMNPAVATCTVTSMERATIVNLSCADPPTEVPCRFEPAQVSAPAGGEAFSNLTFDMAFGADAATYTVEVAGIGTGGLRKTAAIELTIEERCSEFIEQESYSGDACGTGQGICWGFPDGYRVFTPGEFFGAPFVSFECGSFTVGVARSSAADYQHPIGTSFLKRAPSTR